MSDIIFPTSPSSLPEDSILDVPCPVKSTATVVSMGGQLQKVTLDVPCRKKCPWYMERDGHPTCAVAVLALSVAERA